MLRGEYWLSVKAVNVRSGVRCAAGASEGLCWSGGVLLIIVSSSVFFMPLCDEFIIMMILLLFRWKEDVWQLD